MGRKDRDGHDAWVEWIAGEVRDDAVVVLSQWVQHHHGQYTLHPIDGRRFVLRDYSLAIYGKSDQDLQDLAGDASNEIEEPDGPGVLLDVPWADGLVAVPGEVQWHGAAIEQASQLRSRRNSPPQSQNPAGETLSLSIGRADLALTVATAPQRAMSSGAGSAQVFHPSRAVRLPGRGHRVVAGVSTKYRAGDGDPGGESEPHMDGLRRPS